MTAEKVSSQNGHAAGRDVRLDAGATSNVNTVHGKQGSAQAIQLGGSVSGSGINTGGVTVVVNQSARPFTDVQRERQTTFSELLEAIAGLKPQEQKSFLKFANTAFSDRALNEVGIAELKRVNAYVAAIYETRK